MYIAVLGRLHFVSRAEVLQGTMGLMFIHVLQEACEEDYEDIASTVQQDIQNNIDANAAASESQIFGK